jgi:hypothetical protein
MSVKTIIDRLLDYSTQANDHEACAWLVATREKMPASKMPRTHGEAMILAEEASDLEQGPAIPAAKLILSQRPKIILRKRGEL